MRNLWRALVRGEWWAVAGALIAVMWLPLPDALRIVLAGVLVLLVLRPFLVSIVVAYAEGRGDRR